MSPSHPAVVVYQFKAPAQLWLRHSDGRQVRMGYGIGDAVAVVDTTGELSSATLTPFTPPDEVRLTNGSILKGLFGADVVRTTHVAPGAVLRHDLSRSMDADLPSAKAPRARARM